MLFYNDITRTKKSYHATANKFVDLCNHQTTYIFQRNGYNGSFMFITTYY